jgi:hypothetical protein
MGEGEESPVLARVLWNLEGMGGLTREFWAVSEELFFRPLEILNRYLVCIH